MSQKKISYSLEEFIKYRNMNKDPLQELEVYRWTNKNLHDLSLKNYSDEMKMIITTINSGKNTNDVIFINDVKYLINTINKKNYGDYLSKFKKMDFSSKENVQFLAHELIVGTMRCPIAIKGIYQSNQENKSLSELLVSAIKYFCVNILKDKGVNGEKNGNSVNFKDELLKISHKFFVGFVDLTKSMDQSNENTFDNYKGFMTLLGLMFEQGIIPQKILIGCVDSIMRSIFCSKVNNVSAQIINETTIHHEKMFGYKNKIDKDLQNHIVYYDTPSLEDEEPICYRSQIECSNIYKGYENLINHIIHGTENKITDLQKKMKSHKTNLVKIKELYNNVKNGTIEKNVLREIPKYSKIESNDEILELILKEIEESENEILSIPTQYERYKQFIKQIILSHDKITLLNNKFVALNKQQKVQPLKHHITIIHKEKAEKLEELLNFIESNKIE